MPRTRALLYVRPIRASSCRSFVRLCHAKNVPRTKSEFDCLETVGHTCHYGVIEIPMFLSTLSFRAARKKRTRALNGTATRCFFGGNALGNILQPVMAVTVTISELYDKFLMRLGLVYVMRVNTSAHVYIHAYVCIA